MHACLMFIVVHIPRTYRVLAPIGAVHRFARVLSKLPPQTQLPPKNKLSDIKFACKCVNRHKPLSEF
jgi:hypothetical protein